MHRINSDGPLDDPFCKSTPAAGAAVFKRSHRNLFRLFDTLIECADFGPRLVMVLTTTMHSEVASTAYEVVLDASFAPSHPTSPPPDQLEKDGGCRNRPVPLAVIIAPDPPSRALVNGTAPHLHSARSAARATHGRPRYFCFNAKIELMNPIIGREVSFHR